MAATPAIAVDGISKRYRRYNERNQSLKAAVMRRGRASYDEFWALDDVSFDIPAGSSFGLIGANGSGKSTMLQCIARILTPNKGEIRTLGKVAALLELGAGFHPELSGRENVYLNGSVLGLTKKQIDDSFDEIVAFAGLEDFIDTPVKNYSSGMYVRLGFSIAIHVEPDILLIDEVLAVGDAEFQRKCGEKITDLKAGGRTIVLVSHALDTVTALCDTAALLDKGKLIAVGPSGELVSKHLGMVHLDHTADGEHGVKWGSGEARVSDIELVDDAGHTIESPRTGEPLTIRLRYETEERVERPVFCIAIHTLGGVEISAPKSIHQQLVPDAIDGTGVVDLRIPAFMLLPGTYDLSTSIVDETLQHKYEVRHRGRRFDVDPGDPFEPKGLLAMGGHWTFSPDDNTSGSQW